MCGTLHLFPIGNKTPLGGGKHRLALVVFGSVRGCSECPVGPFAAVFAWIPQDGRPEWSVCWRGQRCSLAGLWCLLQRLTSRVQQHHLSEVFLPGKLVTHLSFASYLFCACCVLLWLLGTQQ